MGVAAASLGNELGGREGESRTSHGGPDDRSNVHSHVRHRGFEPSNACDDIFHTSTSISALQRRTVPTCKPRARLVRALEKRHQLALR